MVSNWFTGEALCFDCREKRRNILEKAIFQRLAAIGMSLLGEGDPATGNFSAQLRAIT
jgi:hypothetical protein